MSRTRRERVDEAMPVRRRRHLRGVGAVPGAARTPPVAAEPQDRHRREQRRPGYHRCVAVVAPAPPRGVGAQERPGLGAVEGEQEQRGAARAVAASGEVALDRPDRERGGRARRCGPRARAAGSADPRSGVSSEEAGARPARRPVPASAGAEPVDADEREQAAGARPRAARPSGAAPPASASDARAEHRERLPRRPAGRVRGRGGRPRGPRPATPTGRRPGSPGGAATAAAIADARGDHEGRGPPRPRRASACRRDDDAQSDVPSVAGANGATGPTTTTRDLVADVPRGRRRAPAAQLAAARRGAPASPGRGRGTCGATHLRRRRARLRSVEPHRVGTDHDVDRAAGRAGRSASTPSSHSTVSVAGGAGQHLGVAEELGHPARRRVPVDLLGRARPARPRRRASPRRRRRATGPPAGRGSRAARSRRRRGGSSTTSSRRATRRPASSDANGSSSRIDLGARCQRAGQRDPLALAARELVGVATGRGRRGRPARGTRSTRSDVGVAEADVAPTR